MRIVKFWTLAMTLGSSFTQAASLSAQQTQVLRAGIDANVGYLAVEHWVQPNNDSPLETHLVTFMAEDDRGKSSDEPLAKVFVKPAKLLVVSGTTIASALVGMVVHDTTHPAGSQKPKPPCNNSKHGDIQAISLTFEHWI